MTKRILDMEEKRKYYYRDYRDSSNNCVVTSMTQVSKLCGIGARRIAELLKGGVMYCDPGGSFYIERVVVVKDGSKSRKASKRSNRFL